MLSDQISVLKGHSHKSHYPHHGTKMLIVVERLEIWKLVFQLIPLSVSHFKQCYLEFIHLPPPLPVLAS